MSPITINILCLIILQHTSRLVVNAWTSIIIVIFVYVFLILLLHILSLTGQKYSNEFLIFLFVINPVQNWPVHSSGPLYNILFPAFLTFVVPEYRINFNTKISSLYFILSLDWLLYVHLPWLQHCSYISCCHEYFPLRVCFDFPGMIIITITASIAITTVTTLSLLLFFRGWLYGFRIEF